jgi:hypothetical protein
MGEQWSGKVPIQKAVQKKRKRIISSAFIIEPNSVSSHYRSAARDCHIVPHRLFGVSSLDTRPPSGAAFF